MMNLRDFIVVWNAYAIQDVEELRIKRKKRVESEYTSSREEIYSTIAWKTK